MKLSKLILLVVKFGILLFLFVASWHIRMNSVEENGIRGADTFQYLDISSEWIKGNFVMNDNPKEYTQYYRPLFYSLNVLSFKIFGYNDYAMRSLIGVFESLNGLLCLAIGWIFFQSFWWALLLFVLYLGTSSTIFMSQIELPHTYSVTFVLCMFLAFLVADSHSINKKKISLSWLFISGLFGGCAANIHGSTTFLGPAMVLVLALSVFSRENLNSRKDQWREFIKLAFVFTTGFFLVYLIFGAIVGYAEMVHAIRSEKHIRTGSELGSFTLFLTFLTEGPAVSLGEVWRYLFAPALILNFWMFYRKKFSLKQVSPAILISTSLILFSITFKNVFYPRLFLPFNVFAYLIILLPAVELFRRSIGLRKLATASAAIALVAYAGYSEYLRHEGTLWSFYHGKEKGGPRAVYDVIGEKVDESSRLLVAPYLQYYHRLQFKAPTYFGKNAIYLMDCKDMSLVEYVKEKKIKFIFLSKDVDKRMLNSEAFPNLGSCTEGSSADFSNEADVAFIIKTLQENGAKLIASFEVYGDLYEFPEEF